MNASKTVPLPHRGGGSEPLESKQTYKYIREQKCKCTGLPASSDQKSHVLQETASVLK